MKKILSVIIAIFMCAVIFTGCSQSADSNNTNDNSTDSAENSSKPTNTSQNNSAQNSSSPVNITLWHYYTGDSQALLEDLINEFNQTLGLEEGIIVNPVAVGTIAELEDAVTDSAKGVINSEPMPDIFSCYADKALELSSLDALCDLNNYYDEDEKSQFVPQFLSDGIINDSLYVIPVVKSTEVFYINNTELNNFYNESENASASQNDIYTWNDIYNIAKNYYEWTDAQTSDTLWDGKSFMGFDSLANYIIISSKQQGVDIINGQNDCVNLDKTSLKQIFDNYYLGYSLGYYGETGKFRSDDVKTGDLVAYVGSSSSAGYFPEWEERDGSKIDIELAVSTYPSFTDESTYTIQQGAGMAVAKGDASKEKASAVFLKWFTDVDQNIKFATDTGYLPVKTAAYDQNSIDDILDSIDNVNVKKVYEVGVEQVTQNSTYAPVPFDGSYGVRQLLQSSLKEIADAGKASADELKAQNSDEQTILDALESDAKFDEWYAKLTSALDSMQIKYVES